jgi:hypothetical protein
MSQRHRLRARAERRCRIWLAIACSLTALLASAVPAQADDASVARAYRMQDAASLILQRQAGPAFATFERTGRTGPILGLLSRTRAVVVRTNTAVLGQQASTAAGASARDYGLRALGLLNRAILSLQGGLRASDRGERILAGRLIARGETQLKYADRADRQARILFAQAGV